MPFRPAPQSGCAIYEAVLTEGWFISGSSTNENAAQVAILMTRQGTCYSDAVSLPEEKFKASRSRLRTIWSFVSSLTLADVVPRLGLDIKGEIGTAKGMPVDAKASIAFTKPSEGYRIHTYRNVGCARHHHGKSV